MWVLQYSTWTIVTHPSYAFWGTALVTILADWMFLWYCSCLSTDFCLLGRLLSSSRQNGQHHTNTPDWLTFVSSLIKDPCTCTRSSCLPWRRFSFSIPIWLQQWRKREGFSHEQCCECAASTWVFNFYAPRVLWHRVHCNWTHPALYFELWQSSLRPDSLPFQTYRFLWRSDGRWRQAKQTNKNLLNKSSHLPEIQNRKFLVITWSMTHLFFIRILISLHHFPASKSKIFFKLPPSRYFPSFATNNASLDWPSALARFSSSSSSKYMIIMITIASCHHHLHHDDSLDREGEESWRYEGVGKAQIAQQVKSQMMMVGWWVVCWSTTMMISFIDTL